MRKAKHRRRWFQRGGASIAVIAVAGMLLLGGGTGYAALRYDRSNASTIMPGVSIDGIDVGEMTRDQAMRVVQARADQTLSSRLAVEAAGKTWDVTPSGLGMRARVAEAVDQALAIDDSMSFLSRVWHRATANPVEGSITLAYTYDDAEIRAFVDRAYDAVTRRARSAELSLVDGQVVKHHSRPGQELKAGLAAQKIKAALEHQVTSVSIPVKPVEPEVTEEQLGKTIVVRISEHRLYLYNGLEIEKSYPVATAMPGFVTPVGSWEIVRKVENPTWINPAPDGWGAGEPAVIPPGPGNPLGTRALYLNASGIRIHGTYNTASVGTYASHGCIRMTIWDSEELYPLVPVGTRVLIVP